MSRTRPKLQYKDTLVITSGFRRGYTGVVEKVEVDDTKVGFLGDYETYKYNLTSDCPEVAGYAFSESHIKRIRRAPGKRTLANDLRAAAAWLGRFFGGLIDG